jgi:hypothetical protein
MWMHTPVIPAVGRLRQEDNEFETTWVHSQIKDSLGYI